MTTAFAASMTAAGKYERFKPVDLKDRIWPNVEITTAPRWCSVDLRDGNQALVEPMGFERKLRMWDALVAMGFKEIEVGFPAASQTDFDFVRMLIEENRIPQTVSIQVLTQCRERLIARTLDAVRGAPRAIVHFYNSTSALQRKVVFGQARSGVVKIAVEGAKLVKAMAEGVGGGGIGYEYSPESFTGAELDFSVEICEAVAEAIKPTPKNKLIVNLPATVEMAGPHIYADQIEWFCRTIKNRDSLVISIHPHNDRGGGAAELAIMAGGERIEGALFGNGERAGNVDIVTLALNLFTQGVDPQLDCSDIQSLVDTSQYCTRLPVHPRHPYAGELVHTAFSGSHQDAISKGLAARRASNSPVWDVPYLPIDPTDVGRDYEAVIRINSQSGKGGVAYILERDHGLKPPRRLRMEFSKIVQRIADAEERELGAQEIWEAFETEYLTRGTPQSPWRLVEYATTPLAAGGDDLRSLKAMIETPDGATPIEGEGNGPIDAFANAMNAAFDLGIEVLDYSEHAVGAGADAQAVCYIEANVRAAGPLYGVGRHANIVMASLDALISAVNRHGR